MADKPKEKPPEPTKPSRNEQIAGALDAYERGTLHTDKR